MKYKYISLLEKFELAMKINHDQMIVPSLMPEDPSPDDIPNDASITEAEIPYGPPLRRFWLAEFIPDGFWPRLICRVATDQHIEQVSEEMRTNNSQTQTKTFPIGIADHNQYWLLFPHAPVTFCRRGRLCR